MFSYQHRYHAGGFADVHKHLALIALLQAFRKKETPFCVLDAYAGEGIYDLHSLEAQKIKEYSSGVGIVLKNKPYRSTLIQQYLALIEQENFQNETRYYPGSASIICSLLRPQDRGIFIEKHPQAIEALRGHFKQDPNAHIHERDAQEALVALVPFKEKRGLIFIDPSYEVKNEYHSLTETIQQVYERFSQAVVALWYPILEHRPHLAMINRLTKLSKVECWIGEWQFSSQSSNQQMLGSGMLIMNLPWQVDKLITEAMNALVPLYPGSSWRPRHYPI